MDFSNYRENLYCLLCLSPKYLYNFGINTLKLLVTIFGNTNPPIGFGASDTTGSTRTRTLK